MHVVHSFPTADPALCTNVSATSVNTPLSVRSHSFHHVRKPVLCVTASPTACSRSKSPLYEQSNTHIPDILPPSTEGLLSVAFASSAAHSPPLMIDSSDSFVSTVSSVDPANSAPLSVTNAATTTPNEFNHP